MPIPVGSGTEVDLVQFSPLFPSASRALLCQHLLHLSVVLQPSIDAAAKPSLSSQTSILLGTPSHSGGLFLQEHYCLALGQEEVADLPLFCVRQRQEALGHEGTCLVPPKLKECACEKVCGLPPHIPLPLLFALSTPMEGTSFWDSRGKKGVGD